MASVAVAALPAVVERFAQGSVDAVGDSLNAEWWTSDQTITTKKVFDAERTAVVQLELVVASGMPESVVAQDAIEVLVNADRQLAQIALIAAIERGGQGGKIVEAHAAMPDASVYVASGL